MFAHSAQRVLVLSLVLSACLSWASIIDRNLVNATTQDLSTDQQSIRDSRYSSDFDFDADPSSTMAEPAEPEEEFDGNVFLDGEALGRAQAKHPQASPSGDHPEPKPTDSFGLPPLLRPEPDQGSGNNKTCPRKRSMVSDPMHLYFAPYVPITTKGEQTGGEDGAVHRLILCPPLPSQQTTRFYPITRRSWRTTCPTRSSNLKLVLRTGPNATDYLQWDFKGGGTGRRRWIMAKCSSKFSQDTKIRQDF